MHNELFHIGNITIYGYGLMIALGILCAVFFINHRATKKYGMDTDMIFNMFFIGIVSGVVGSKVVHWIVEFRSILENPALLLDFRQGFVIYGAVIFAGLALFIYLRFIRKTTVLDKFDLVIPGVSLGQAFGRIGCFLAGCCYGKPVPSGAWYGITFPTGSAAPSGIPLYPTQLISAAFNLLLFFFLWYETNKVTFRGGVFSLYMIFYSVGRFLIEFLRNDPRGTVGIFSTSQFISLFTFVAGIVLFFVLRKKNLPGLPSMVKAGEKESTADPNDPNQDTNE